MSNTNDEYILGASLAGSGYPLYLFLRLIWLPFKMKLRRKKRMPFLSLALAHTIKSFSIDNQNHSGYFCILIISDRYYPCFIKCHTSFYRFFITDYWQCSIETMLPDRQRPIILQVLLHPIHHFIASSLSQIASSLS